MDKMNDYQQILKAALAAEKNGDLAHAESLYDEALNIQQSYEALIGNAQVAQKNGRLNKASQCLEVAYRMQPSANLLFKLIVSLLDAGKLEEAESYAKQGVAKKPNEFDVVNVYGVILKQQGRYKEAIEYLTKAAKIKPNSIAPIINMGNTYMQLENYHKAAECFLKVTKMQPKNGENIRLLASSYINMREENKAIALLKQALVFSPTNYKIWADICKAYYNSQRFEQAVAEIDRALVNFPNNPELLKLQAAILRKIGRVDEALKIYELIIHDNPRDIEAINSLANLYYRDLNNFEQANKYYSSALSINPDNVETAMQYCESLLKSRYGDEAEHIEKAYQIACMLRDRAVITPKVADSIQSAFIRNADYDSLERLGDPKKLLQYLTRIGRFHNQLGRVVTTEDRLDLVRGHREWGKKLEERADANPLEATPHIRQRNKIRIGLMSSDLRNHPVTYFVQPILEHYDHSNFEIYCYSFYSGKPDMVQQRIAKIVDKFSVNLNLPDREIAKMMAADELDILFELGGTTHMNRVEALAYRAAPVQVSWLGYPHSCGLSRLDYILVDPYINPENPALLVEKPFIMPETWVSLGGLGFYDLPIEPELPETRQRHITFGTMNNPYKYTTQVLETWAKIMQRVEGSQFLFVRPEGAVKSFRDNVLEKFTSHGISADRIEFAPVRGKHMPYYNRIDIALDPFPHTGGTTTCEALWMGTPTVTLVGQAFFERLSYSNLNNAGLGDLCAFNIDEYSNIAISLAQNKELRESIRNGMRERIRNHPLGQTQRFVRNFEAKIKEVLS